MGIGAPTAAGRYFCDRYLCFTPSCPITIIIHARESSDKSKRSNTRQSTKLYPFVRSKGSEPLDGIDFDEQDYLKLLDWTGRAIRDGKNGAIADELAPILERVGLNSDNWLKTITHYNHCYFTVLGAINRIKAYAQAQKKCWLQGQTAAVNAYCLAIGQ